MVLEIDRAWLCEFDPGIRTRSRGGGGGGAHKAGLPITCAPSSRTETRSCPEVFELICNVLLLSVTAHSDSLSNLASILERGADLSE